MGAADVGAGGTIGLGGDAAGVDDDQAGIGRLGDGVAGGAQTAAERFAVGARGPATEMLDVKARHEISVEPALPIATFRAIDTLAGTQES